MTVLASQYNIYLFVGQWKALTDEEKEPYEELARQDKDRYLSECATRDAEVLRQQEERRRKNEVGEVLESSKRTSTQAASDAALTKADAPKRMRMISEEERERIEERRQEKKSADTAMKQQHDELKAARAAQAEARLKYLLSQSDIFSHFGVNKKEEAAPSAPKKETSSVSSPFGRRNRESKQNLDEMDDDEKALMAEDEGASGQHAVILKQPSILTGGTLRDYQIEGLNWMIRLAANGINGILADEMGLGKTVQSISVLAYTKQFKGIDGPHLILVPKSTLSNWMNEFARFCPSMRVVRFHGPREEREDFVRDVLHPSKKQNERSWDVCVTTYEICNLEKTALSKIAWRYLIIDEAHRLKNEDSQFAQIVRMMNTQHRLLLTGTPLQNNLHELWALLNFLLPDVFASSEQFDEWFNLDVDDTEAKQRMIGQLHKLLRPFMLRRLKADVEKSLPPKTETILFTGLSTMQKVLYKSILMRDIDTINGAASSKSESSRTAILNIVMQLRKCCNHPYLFPGLEDRTLSPLGEHLWMNCGKMALLDKLLAKMKERGHRVLIFSQMTRMLDILEDYCFAKGYRYCRIDGNTSYDDREERISEYNAPNSETFLFLLSTRAGGLGINLQTADTVILYDSDWNPQADLQAQDRAHRIGQKKPVQVFRLVTDDTVEVKVVERAQQKLKLDAMVVQQGRLQENEKKLSKSDLLDTLRFGADKIFKSKDSTITDDDIEIILEQGKKRTDEMNEKLKVNEKGDLYDFRLDGSISTQMFEGKDYSEKAMRDSEQSSLLAMQMQFLDTGKRERKSVITYSETIARLQADEYGFHQRPKLPRHLKLPRLEDWQFFNRTRLNELQEEELRLFELIIDNGEYPTSNIGKMVVLPPALHEEKTRLLSEGFGDWTRMHFNIFIRATAKCGRTEYEKISKDVGRPADEVKRYAEAFWTQGPTVFSPADWDKHTKTIEKGEKRLEEIQRLSVATAKLINMFEDPWEELTFKHVGTQGRLFNTFEDRYLLCLTHLHGYGNWDLVRSSIRRCERFRFDYYLLSCTSDTIGKRCETLMRSAERELVEIEKKRAVTDSANVQSSSAANSTSVVASGASNTATSSEAATATLVPLNAQSSTSTETTKAPSLMKMSTAELNKEKLNALNKQIAEEAKRLSQLRAEFKSKSQLMAVKDLAPGSGQKAGGPSPSTVPTAAKQAAISDDQAPVPRGTALKPVPSEFLPELCELIIAGGCEGIQKIIAAFTDSHPHVSKRQVEMKINEIGIKEKRPNDSKLVRRPHLKFILFIHK